MFDASGHDEHLAGIERHRAIPQFDVERPLEDQEEVVGVFMLVPVERPKADSCGETCRV
jgi:hypothetical protein